MKRAATWLTLLALSLCLCCLCLPFGAGGIEILGDVIGGPVLFLTRVVPETTVNWGGVATAGVCLMGLAFGLHWFLGWVARHRHPGEDPTVGRPAWRLRWTAAILGVVVLMFVAGIAAVGMTHQTAWLFTSPEPVWTGGIADVAARMTSSNNLKQIGLACHAYHGEMKTLPPGGTFDERGRMLHSWQTFLLPYVEQDNLYRQIDLGRPWDDPANRPAFRTPVHIYLHRANPQTEAEGLALSHYAANVHILGGSNPFSLERIKAVKGLSNTILAGEAAGNFKPWGYPANWRDPARGLNRSPDGFGSPADRHSVTQFLFADGSVRSFDDDADPEFLKLLALPDPER
jgi:hypothetical protein